ncbi:glycosyltransferase family 71 protein, partial [Babjeviella inositovora NRRL Y-12698]
QVNEKEVQEIETVFEAKYKGFLATEQSIVDAATNLRVFGSCYLSHNRFDANKDAVTALKNNAKGKVHVGANNTCAALQERLFPWMLQTYPVFTRWSGETTSEKANRNPADCYILDLLQGFNGKGIVITAGDAHKEDVVNLIRVLRGLDNKLPIQIFHRKDLSQKSQQELKAGVGRSVYDFAFPLQELWFADVSAVVKPEYEKFFSRFANKFFSYLFGSFDETLLMDTDAVPLIKPADFFKTSGYVASETLFFKDREVRQSSARDGRVLFRKMMPRVFDNLLFGIPVTTNFTLHNEYISEEAHKMHLMESGIVAYRKTAHFTGVLMAANLNFWWQVKARVWGDKEMFWLGMSIAGDENYRFNDNYAGAVGILTPEAFHPAVAHEICSIQPGHISSDDDQTLMWINSGFKFCKKPGSFERSKGSEKLLMYSGARSYDDRTGFNDHSIKAMYYDSISIQAAIIPPASQLLRHKTNRREPPLGWFMDKSCSGYLWCAYDSIGASTLPEHQGKLIEFSVVDEIRFKFLGDLW